MGLTQSGELLNEGLEVRGRSSQRDSSTSPEEADCHVIESHMAEICSGRKGPRSSVLQLQGTEFCQQPSDPGQRGPS